MTATYPPVSTPGICSEVAKLSPDAREHFEERAAILEYEGGAQRAAAESVALQQTQRVFK